MSCGSESCVAKPEWIWNESDSKDIYAHVFDQNGPSDGNGIPYQYSTNINDWSSYYYNPSSISRCTPTNASGNLAFSTKNPYTDKACIANIYNAGNLYSFPAATAGSDTHLATSSNNIEAPNSICPKGWQLPPNSDDKSYYNLIYDTYNITTNSSNSQILALPLSFVRLGTYSYDSGSLNSRGGDGHYRSSTAYSDTSSRVLGFLSGSLDSQSGGSKATGWSVRCVSR